MDYELTEGQENEPMGEEQEHESMDEPTGEEPTLNNPWPVYGIPDEVIMDSWEIPIFVISDDGSTSVDRATRGIQFTTLVYTATRQILGMHMSLSERDSDESREGE